MQWKLLGTISVDCDATGQQLITYTACKMGIQEAVHQRFIDL